jgi:hypothetical protein
MNDYWITVITAWYLELYKTKTAKGCTDSQKKQLSPNYRSNLDNVGSRLGCDIKLIRTKSGSI